MMMRIQASPDTTSATHHLKSIGRPARLARTVAGIAVAAALLAAGPALAARKRSAPAPEPAPIAGQVQPDRVRQAGGDFHTFYAARGYRPLWLDQSGVPSTATNGLIDWLDTADIDGLDRATFGADALRAAIRDAASGSPVALSSADLAISRAFVAYALALRDTSKAQTIYEHDALRPQPVRAYHLLQAAADAPSLDAYIGEMAWVHPLYAQLRRSAAGLPAGDLRSRTAVTASLMRIRSIPVARRQIIVDIASARLWMYEDGKPVDSMRVVVGRPSDKTPMLAGYVRYAIVNPYWNVPPELVKSSIARNAISRGPGYLNASGYQVLSDWTDAAVPIDGTKIDWRAAARGELDLRVRQLPRPGNAMGKVKYEFPNQHGIYLHDTPQKDLMLKDGRQFSAGCIRLEDAARLGRWLMNGQPMPVGTDPETRVDLPRPVPIYLTYLTALADQGRLALGADPYGFDAAQRAGFAMGAVTAPVPVEPPAPGKAPLRAD